MELPNVDEDGMWAGPSEPNSIFGHLGGATGTRQKLFRHYNMVMKCNTIVTISNDDIKDKFFVAEYDFCCF